jgi:MarR family transcriptional regulator, transcriptional regulator for hemolysin
MSTLSLVNRPPQEPIGQLVARTGRALNRAFEDALAQAGGSLPTWLVLLSLMRGRWATQSELAESLGIRGPTLTHHLDRLDKEGLITRSRDPDNRRVQRVELTDAGRETFHRLRGVAQSFDSGLRAGLDEDELAQLRRLLTQLEQNLG